MASAVDVFRLHRRREQAGGAARRRPSLAPRRRCRLPRCPWRRRSWPSVCARWHARRAPGLRRRRRPRHPRLLRPRPGRPRAGRGPAAGDPGRRRVWDLRTPARPMSSSPARATACAQLARDVAARVPALLIGGASHRAPPGELRVPAPLMVTGSGPPTGTGSGPVTVAGRGRPMATAREWGEAGNAAAVRRWSCELPPPFHARRGQQVPEVPEVPAGQGEASLELDVGDAVPFRDGAASGVVDAQGPVQLVAHDRHVARRSMITGCWPCARLRWTAPSRTPRLNR